MRPCYFLEGVKEFDARWIGWAGVNVPDEIGQNALTEALAEKVRKSLLHLEVPITYLSTISNNILILNFLFQLSIPTPLPLSTYAYDFLSS